MRYYQTMRNYQHIRFCCKAECARHEMRRLAETMAISPIKLNKTEFTVEIPGYRWRFIFDSKQNPKRIFGSIVDSWDWCGDTFISDIHPTAREYLKTHTGREKW